MYEPRFGLDLEGQPLNVFMCYAFHVVASHPLPVTQLLDQLRGHVHLTLPERARGVHSRFERGMVAEPSRDGFCSAPVLSTQVTLLGGHALDVVEGFIVRVLRCFVEMLDGFWSVRKSVTAYNISQLPAQFPLVEGVGLDDDGEAAGRTDEMIEPLQFLMPLGRVPRKVRLSTLFLTLKLLLINVTHPRTNVRLACFSNHLLLHL